MKMTHLNGLIYNVLKLKRYKFRVPSGVCGVWSSKLCNKTDTASKKQATSSCTGSGKGISELNFCPFQSESEIDYSDVSQACIHSLCSF